MHQLASLPSGRRIPNFSLCFKKWSELQDVNKRRKDRRTGTTELLAIKGV